MSKTLTAAAAAILTLVAASSAQQICSPWTVTPVPFNSAWDSAVLEDVSALSATSAWAVGRYATLTGVAWYDTYTLAMYWDGLTWTQYPTPSPAAWAGPGGTTAILHAVAAVSATDVWAAGEAVGNAGGSSVGSWILVEHFDGVNWSVIPGAPPSGGIGVNFSGTRVDAIVALASNDVWFGGLYAEPNANFGVDWRPLAMHWDGSALTVFPTPVIYSGGYGFRGIGFAALAPNDIYMACRTYDAVGNSTMNVVLHWDGSAWTQVSIPNTTPSHTLRDIVATGPNDIWLFGDNYNQPGAHVIHFNGTSWSQVTGGPYATCAAVNGPGEIYVGTGSIGVYDGTTTTTVETFPQVAYPSVLGLSRFANCGFFAVGRDFPTGSGLRPFAAMTGQTLIPSSAVTRSPCTYPAPPQSLTAINTPRVGQQFFVEAGDPTNAAALTPFSTQSYLIVSAQPALAGPCGLPLSGFGIGSGPGELMVDVGANLIAVLGPVPWGGVLSPALHWGVVPNIPALAGFAVYEQAILIDLAGPSSPGVLTEALDLIIGS